MVVYEIMMERFKDGSKEVMEVRQYATSEKNTLISVVTHFTKRCKELEWHLLSVREILVISEVIK